MEHFDRCLIRRNFRHQFRKYNWMLEYNHKVDFLKVSSYLMDLLRCHSGEGLQYFLGGQLVVESTGFLQPCQNCNQYLMALFLSCLNHLLSCEFVCVQLAHGKPLKFWLEMAELGFLRPFKLVSVKSFSWLNQYY